MNYEQLSRKKIIERIREAMDLNLEIWDILFEDNELIIKTNKKGKWSFEFCIKDIKFVRPITVTYPPAVAVQLKGGTYLLFDKNGGFALSKSEECK